ncbi:MAG: hypothetical protein PHW00_03075 [Clostridia bacterium]|nr:hypothetical protein [Clostridia bacterium]
MTHINTSIKRKLHYRAVKEAVANGLICAERYERYKTIVSQLIDAHKCKY